MGVSFKVSEIKGQRSESNHGPAEVSITAGDGGL